MDQLLFGLVVVLQKTIYFLIPILINTLILLVQSFAMVYYYYYADQLINQLDLLIDKSYFVVFICEKEEQNDDLRAV